MAVLTGIRILLVEDDEDSLAMLCTALKQYGATADCVSNAGAALELARKRRPDVLVSDLRMADNGAKLARAIDVPAIAYSGDHRLKQRALDVGFVRFFLKPVELAVLAAAVRELAGR